MKCTHCSSSRGLSKKQTEVINSRLSGDGFSVWRRRKCLTCGYVFTTKESYDYESLFVTKRNGARKRFVYEKLFASVLFSVFGGKHGDVGDASLLAKEVTEGVIGKILEKRTRDISSQDIILLTYEELMKCSKFFADKYCFYSEFRMGVVRRSVQHK